MQINWYTMLVRPILFSMSAENAHRLTIQALKCLQWYLDYRDSLISDLKAMEEKFRKDMEEESRKRM